MNINEIALKSGFSNPTFFYKNIKKSSSSIPLRESKCFYKCTRQGKYYFCPAVHAHITMLSAQNPRSLPLTHASFVMLTVSQRYISSEELPI